MKDFAFGPDSVVLFKQKPSYQRDAMLSSLSSRRRRAIDGTNSHVITVTFRTKENQGLLFHSASGSGYTALMVGFHDRHHHVMVTLLQVPIMCTSFLRYL